MSHGIYLLLKNVAFDLVHIVTVQESKPVLKLSWNPTRSVAATFITHFSVYSLQ